MTKMNEKEGWSTNIRKQAEDALKGKTRDLRKLSSGDVQSIVHELQVRQIELEMQNEELRRAQKELEDAHNRYSDMYDFAPAGYFTFMSDGKIREANLTGAVILGGTRHDLINHGFRRFVIPRDFEQWDHHLSNALKNWGKQSCELTLKREGVPCYWFD